MALCLRRAEKGLSRQEVTRHNSHNVLYDDSMIFQLKLNTAFLGY